MTAEELLKQDPMMAVKQMAASIAGHGATPDWFVIRKISTHRTLPVAVVDLDYNELFVPLELRHGITTPMSIAVDKMDLGLLNVGGPVRLNLSSIYTEKSYRDLLAEAFNHVGLVITEEDIAPVTPNLSDTEVKAADTSVRWYGSVKVDMNLIEEDIEKFIKISHVILDHTKVYSVDSVLNDLRLALNRTNPTTLPVTITEEMVAFLDGNVTLTRNHTHRGNSQIDLAFDYPYSGSLTVTYNRRNFHRTFTNPILLEPTGPITPEEVLEGINEELESDIRMEELEPFAIPTANHAGREMVVEGRYMLSLKPESIAHVGDIWIELRRDYGP